MWMAGLVFLAAGARAAIPVEAWRCTNDVEVWCSDEGCAAKPEAETTPMAVSAHRNGAFSVCAYTGCWEGKARIADIAGRIVWAADDVAFSTRPDGLRAGVSLMIIEADGVGFVRVGAIASPLRCLRWPAPEQP